MPATLNNKNTTFKHQGTILRKHHLRGEASFKNPWPLEKRRNFEITCRSNVGTSELLVRAIPETRNWLFNQLRESASGASTDSAGALGRGFEAVLGPTH
eukprot:15169304-Alexandrium_andersonii.AAC.1